MPTIARPCTNHKVALVIYPDDHAPPHCHLQGDDWEACIDLQTLTVDRGWAPPKERREAIEYLRRNIEFVMSQWSKYVERD